MATRYTYITWTDQNDRPMVDFNGSKTGDWVKYRDHAAEITQLRAELERERELADRAVDALRLHYVDEISVRNVKAVGVIVLHDARRNK